MMQVPVEQKVLSENDKIAARLRAELAESGALSLNFISSPGSGKTQFLERTLEMFPRSVRAAVLTGDIQTDNDAKRLSRYGFPVRQISTGGACHLDARMVEKHLTGWRAADLDYLFIENVGNLVCPTSYDLGEDAKVVILSVTEGEDKPLKYPGIFRKSELMIINKIDLLPYVPFWVKLARDHARQINPKIEIIEMSALTGDGFDQWFDWLNKRAQMKKEAGGQSLVSRVVSSVRDQGAVPLFRPQ